MLRNDEQAGVGARARRARARLIDAHPLPLTAREIQLGRSSLPDHERPLAPRGRRDAKRIAKHFARLGIEPGLVLCSPAVRTRETLELVRPALGVMPTVRLEAELYAASSDKLLEHIRVVPEAVASVMLIGHNPGLQQLALVLASSGAELERVGFVNSISLQMGQTRGPNSRTLRARTLLKRDP